MRHASVHYNLQPSSTWPSSPSPCAILVWLEAHRPTFRTIQICPKDLRALPGHPEPEVSWHSGFREGSPCST